MRFSLTALVRLLVYTALGLNVVAIGLGRMFPEGPRGRWLQSSRQVQLDNSALQGALPSVRVLDASTGKVRTLDLPSGERLEMASGSPWRDEAGEIQLVGRWAQRSGEPGDTGLDRIGLGRISFPSGRLLDRIESEILPAAPPCWAPGTTAKVVFAAGDGQLYRFAFEADSAEDDASGAIGRPTLISWAIPQPGGRRAFLRDPFWPSDPRLGGKLIVSLCEYDHSYDRPRYARPKLWWIQLDPAHARIVGAGPLIAADRDQPELARRHSTVVTAPGGRLLLACLTRRAGGGEWRPTVAPLVLRGRDGSPCVEPDAMRTLDAVCLPSTPTFSPDGKSLYCVAPEGAAGTRRVRLAVDGPSPSVAADGRPTVATALR